MYRRSGKPPDALAQVTLHVVGANGGHRWAAPVFLRPLLLEVSTMMTADRIPPSWVEVAQGAGHFPWHERPGSVRRALDRLVGT